MTENEERAALVAEAQSWIKTPYHTGARIKGVGADCLTFIVCAYENAALIPPYQIPHYPPDWHLHRKDERYLDGVREFCDEVSTPGVFSVDLKEALPGDVVMWRWGFSFSHAAIVTEWPRVVHAYVRRAIAEVDLTQEPWITRIGENVDEKGRLRPMKLLRLKRWAR
jgi:NlpC/P60 family putative phage cell wall peptidase